MNKSAEDAFRNVLVNMRAFGQVEITALCLPSVRKDPQLAKTLADFRDGFIDSNFFKQTLLDVVDRVIQETDYKTCRLHGRHGCFHQIWEKPAQQAALVP